MKDKSISRFLSPDSCRAISEPRKISISARATPIQNGSPSTSSFLPKILRESFSKLLNRTAKSVEKESILETEYYNYNNYESQSMSLSSSNSPGTEDVVKESLRDGLPIIPFAYPTFFTSSQKLEADSRLRRKSQSLYSKQRALGSGIGEDGVFQMDHEDECGGKSLQTLDSIVEMAKLQMEGDPLNVIEQQECQSSYVEMSRDDTAKDCDYFCMENKKCGLKPGNIITTRRSKSNLREKGGVVEKGFCKRFKKSKRHKEDYALLDFEEKTDYQEIVGTNKKWHFLD